MTDEGLSPMPHSSVHAMGELGCCIRPDFSSFFSHRYRGFVNGETVSKFSVLK